MTRDYELQDSGQRRTFSTGAVRDRGDLKPRPDLISPHAQLREGMVLAKGAVKYDLRNWEKGMPICECIASAQRHIEQYKLGLTDEDHLAQARTNLGFAIHIEEEVKAGRLPAELDDMPKYAGHRLQDLQRRVRNGELLNDAEAWEFLRLLEKAYAAVGKKIIGGYVFGGF